MRLFPEREKQNERYLGSVETGLSADVTDLVDRDAFCVLVAGDGLKKCERSPRLARLKAVVEMVPVRIEGSIWAGTTSGSGGLCGRKCHGAAPGEAVVDVAAICRLLVMIWWHWGQRA